MKKITLFLFFSFIVATTFAQQAVVKVNPFNPILGRYTIGGEVAIQKSSISLLVSRLHFDLGDFNFKTSQDNTVRGSVLLSSWGFMPEYRYYTGQQTLKGFYVGAYANYAGGKADIDVDGGTPSTTGSAKVRFSNSGLGGLLGYQFLIKDRFAIDVFGGLGGFWYNVKDFDLVYQDESVVNQEIPFPIAGIFPRLGVNLGVAF